MILISKQERAIILRCYPNSMFLVPTDGVY